MRRFWVYTISLQDKAPPLEWLVFWEHHRTEMWFPKNKRPACVSAGDRAVIYGSQAENRVSGRSVRVCEARRGRAAGRRVAV